MHCGGNDLTNLDVSNNTALRELRCGGNDLTSLNISKNIKLFAGRAVPGILDLSNMPTLYEVCVWEMPFPPTDKVDLVDTTGSPNIYFTTECSDFEAPYIVAVDTLYQPDFIEATSTEDGMIYLVPEDTEKDIVVIRGVSIDSIAAVSNTPVNIPLSGLDNGIYWLYARDSTGNISEPEAFTIMGVGIEYYRAEHIKIYPNPTNTQLNIETGISDLYNIEITSLNGQLMLSKEMEGTSHHIDLSAFQRGIYFITIRSKDFVTTEKIIKL